MLVIWLNRQSACLPERRKVCRNAVSLSSTPDGMSLGEGAGLGLKFSRCWGTSGGALVAGSLFPTLLRAAPRLLEISAPQLSYNSFPVVV